MAVNPTTGSFSSAAWAKSDSSTFLKVSHVPALVALTRFPPLANSTAGTQRNSKNLWQRCSLTSPGFQTTCCSPPPQHSAFYIVLFQGMLSHEFTACHLCKNNNNTEKKKVMFLSRSQNEACQQSWASPASRSPASHCSAPAVTPLQLLQQTPSC